MISQAELKAALLYDDSTGLFSRRTSARVKTRAGGLLGSVCHTGSGKKLRISVNGRLYTAHRLVWLYVHGEWPQGDVDHINGDQLDNRIENLRCVSRSVNMQNQRRARADNSTGFLGVYRKHGKFAACIGVGGKNISLGLFGDPESAHAAYLNAKRAMHAGCTI